jgi:hypothetical protein
VKRSLLFWKNREVAGAVGLSGRGEHTDALDMACLVRLDRLCERCDRFAERDETGNSERQKGDEEDKDAGNFDWSGEGVEPNCDAGGKKWRAHHETRGAGGESTGACGLEAFPQSPPRKAARNCEDRGHYKHELSHGDEQQRHRPRVEARS